MYGDFLNREGSEDITVKITVLLDVNNVISNSQVNHLLTNMFIHMVTSNMYVSYVVKNFLLPADLNNILKFILPINCLAQ